MSGLCVLSSSVCVLPLVYTPTHKCHITLVLAANYETWKLRKLLYSWRNWFVNRNRNLHGHMMLFYGANLYVQLLAGSYIFLILYLLFELLLSLEQPCLTLLNWGTFLKTIRSRENPSIILIMIK